MNDKDRSKKKEKMSCKIHPHLVIFPYKISVVSFTKCDSKTAQVCKIFKNIYSVSFYVSLDQKPIFRFCANVFTARGGGGGL